MNAAKMQLYNCDVHITRLWNLLRRPQVRKRKQTKLVRFVDNQGRKRHLGSVGQGRGYSRILYYVDLGRGVFFGLLKDVVLILGLVVYEN
jgi:hypothetical protein